MSLIRKGIPESLLRLIEDYLDNGTVIYKDQVLQMTCVALQWSKLGPVLRNLMYDDLLRIEMLENT